MATLEEIITEAQGLYTTLEQTIEAKILKHVGELETQLEKNRKRVTELITLLDNYYRPTGNFKPNIAESFQYEVRSSAANRTVYSQTDGIYYADLRGWDVTDKVAACLLLQDPTEHYKTVPISPTDRRRLWGIASPLASKEAREALVELGEAEGRVRRLVGLRDRAAAYSDAVTVLFPRGYIQ